MATVRDACHAAGSVVRVAEGTTTGQWTAAMARQRNDAKTERRQRAALEMDAHIAQLRKKGDAESVRRADLHEEKIAVDERLRACKNALTEAKTACSDARGLHGGDQVPRVGRDALKRRSIALRRSRRRSPS